MLGVLHRLTKEQKTPSLKMPIFYIDCQNGNKSIVSELLKVDGTWIYKFEPQRRVNDQARPAIVNEQKAR